MQRLTLSIAILSSMIARAQIPNPDFELWTYTLGRPEPNGWLTYNNFTNNVYHVIPVAPGFESDTALNSRTIYTGISVFPGFAQATFSLTTRPLGLAWYSKHVRQHLDTVRITCTLDPGSSPIGTMNWEPSSDSDTIDYVFNYEPIVYTSGANPSSARITLEGGDDFASQTGTYVIVDRIHFCDFPPPSGSLTVTGPATVHENDTVTFTASGAIGASGYSWSLPADVVAISGDSTDQITAIWGSNPGTVKASSINDCGPGPEDDFLVDVISGTYPSAFPDAVIAFPNPATDWITISSDESWEITDLSGRMCLSGSATSDVTSINVHHLGEGVYILRAGWSAIRITINR